MRFFGKKITSTGFAIRKVPRKTYEALFHDQKKITLYLIFIGWLNWRKGGPGTGWYTLYVRAVDAAGNRDLEFVAGENVYQWRYVSPTPWDIIFGVT
jgi:hypothetical protein